MNLGSTLRGLSRRWWILVIGLLLAASASGAAFAVAHPTYERSATLLLLPGKGSLPSDSQNPFLFLGGLTFAADILVRATGSENMQHQIELEHPGTSFEVIRDPTTAGPVIRITVTAGSADESEVVLKQLTDEAASALHDLQAAENIGANERITTITVTMDDHATVRNRMRIALSVAAGLAVAGLTVAVSAIAEGLSVRRQTKPGSVTISRRGVVRPATDEDPQAGEDHTASSALPETPSATTPSEAPLPPAARPDR